MICWAVAAVAVGAILSRPVPAGEAEPGECYAVVVSPNVPVSGLSMDHLRRVFLFRERFLRPGSAVQVILSEAGLRQNSFLLQRIYRMDAGALRQLILQKLYQQEIDVPPKIVASDEVAAEYVAAGQGLLAVVSAAAARGKPLKILSVDGIPPGPGGCSLRR